MVLAGPKTQIREVPGTLENLRIGDPQEKTISNSFIEFDAGTLPHLLSKKSFSKPYLNIFLVIINFIFDFWDPPGPLGSPKVKTKFSHMKCWVSN